MRKCEEGAAMQVADGRARHGCRDEGALGEVFKIGPWDIYIIRCRQVQELC
jgi:hypothetical protein